MKNLLLLTIFIILSPGLGGNSIAQEFSSKSSMIVFSECLKVLGEYQRLVNDLAESGQAGFEGSMGTSERLMELFINRKVLIYNDLDPQHRLSEYYELETYTSNMLLWYPDGIHISLDLDNAKTSEIRTHDEGLYSTDIMVRKQIKGNYLNQSMNTNTEELIFRIAFTGQNNNFGEFRIVGVRSIGSAGFQADNRALYRLKSIELSEIERGKVLSDIRQVVNDYQRSLIMLGDPGESEEDKVFYLDAFLHLFPDSAVMVFNDIEEKPDKTIIPVEEYVNNYRAFFPEGIKNLAVNIDSAEFSDIIPVDDGSYYSYVYADKFFSGKFLNKGIYRSSENLVFKIVFVKKENLFTDFRIGSIDRSGLAFLQSTGQTDEQAAPSRPIQPITRKGFHLAVHANAGYSSVVSKNIGALTMETNYHEWQTEPLLAYSGGVGAEYFFNDHIGIGIGAGYSYLATTSSLEGRFMEGTAENPVLSYDINGDPFNKRIDAGIDSIIKISCLQFPLQLTVLTNKPRKTGLYVKAGVIASVLLDASYEYNGKLDYWGFYPGYTPPLDSMSYPEMGYYTITGHSGDAANLKKFFVSGTLSAGINIPLAYFTTLQIGPVFHFSITDLAEKSDYYDIFGTKYAHKPVSLNYLGLEICIRFL